MTRRLHSSLSNLNYFIIVIVLVQTITVARGFGLIKPVVSENNNSDNINTNQKTVEIGNNDPSPLIGSTNTIPSNFLKSSYFNILQMKEDIMNTVEPLLPPPILFIYNRIKKIILYKPPVGMAAFYIAYHWLFKREKFSILDTAEQQNEKRNNRRIRQQRSMNLDITDRECYDMYGGIESTRVDLCHMYIDHRLKLCDDNDDDYEMLYYLNQALSISCPPRSSRELFIERNIDFLDKLFYYGLISTPSVLNIDNSKKSASNRNDDNVMIMNIAAKVIEMRVVDALLRTLRDRLLLSAKRLEKNERYWSWRVRWYEGRFRISTYMKRVTRQFIFQATLEDDRHQLSLAQALLTKETERLGIVQQILLSRPLELSKTILLNVPTTSTSSYDNKENTMKDVKALLLPKKDESNWLNLASDWACEARTVLYKVVSNSTISSTTTEEETITTNTNSPLLEWSKCAKNDKQSWIGALASVDNLPKARRDDVLSHFANWFKRVDFKGVPSSIATLIVSLVIHETLKPRWNNIVDTVLSTSDIVKGIIDRRFYTPLRDIVLDLLNRRPRLLDPFALQIEETSLDNMLRDLGIVKDINGVYDRAEALSKAASMYEAELRNGPIRGFFRGNMVRLLLIQIQQLKTDLLIAMGTIDDLVDANRLNVQLLASIPSVLLVVLGTRLFFIILYSFKSKDIYFPTRDVYAKMSDYLFQMERCLILSDNNSEYLDRDSNMLLSASKQSSNNKKVKSEDEEASVYLNPLQLGEFILLVHKYLLLLDFSTPPISKKVSDAIHRSMQDLMQQGQLNTSLQLSLLRLIRGKHEELAKSL